MQRSELDLDPALIAAIKGLSSTDQHLLALVALEDYTLRAAAETLGITEQAARSRWQRVRRRLAQDHIPDPVALALEN
jgi:DNA-directed RNA polymerase specialized sigma24 family protein